MKNYRLLKSIAVCACVITMSSCDVIRGYIADGQSGPNSYSFEHRDVDTIYNGSTKFVFPYAKQQIDWLDTFRFFVQSPMYMEPVSMWEALDKKTDTQGVLIIYNDSIIYERCKGDITTDRLATVFSVSKSITSLLCGIAVDEGYIRSIDDPVTDYLPELKECDPMWQKLTVSHLLDMRSGLDFSDLYSFKFKDLKRLNAMAKLNYGKDLMKQIRGLKFACEPGTQYNYESMTAAVLGIVIQRATGQRYVDYLSEKVWKPLQMESPAVINIDSRKNDMPHAFGGISTTMKDLAKIGRLYLNMGMWDGKRIVSEEWIRQSTEYNPDNEGYHRNWYNTGWIEGFRPEYPGYYAVGIRGQVLYVNPYRNLIMIRFGLKNDDYSYIPFMFETLSNL